MCSFFSNAGGGGGFSTADCQQTVSKDVTDVLRGSTEVFSVYEYSLLVGTLIYLHVVKPVFFF